MPRRSCLTNLIVAEELITGMTDQGEPVDVVILDLSKAFDSVCHRQEDGSSGDQPQNNTLGGGVPKQQEATSQAKVS